MRLSGVASPLECSQDVSPLGAVYFTHEISEFLSPCAFPQGITLNCVDPPAYSNPEHITNPFGGFRAILSDPPFKKVQYLGYASELQT